MDRGTPTLAEALAHLRAALGKPKGRGRGTRYLKADPAALRHALRCYVEAWEAWRGEGGEGWFLARPLAERALANEAKATSRTVRDVLRALDPDGEVPMVSRSDGD